MIHNQFSIEDNLLPPLKLDSEQQIDWQATADVVVVGFGGAGACAALEAAENGADVIAIERFSGGGSTAISGGIVYAGGGTAVQKEAGVDDSAENMFNYLKHEVKDSVSEQTLRRFCDQSVDNFDWLRQHGVPFSSAMCPFKTSYPPNQYYYYYSGNEYFSPYSDDAKPAARGHRAHRKGISGAGFFEPLKSAALQSGVKIKTQSRVRRLLQDSQGKVLGVEASVIPKGSLAALTHHVLDKLLTFLRYVTMFMPFLRAILQWMIVKLETKFARPANIRARKGVILSAGGFFFNREMVKEHAPNYIKGAPLGTIGDDGSGIRLAQAIGAETGFMSSVSAWRFVNPPEAFARGIILNRNGERICNEMLYGAQLAEQMIQSHDGKGFILIDSKLWKLAHEQIGLKKAMWFQSATALMYLYLERTKARSLEELADKMGMPVATLKATVEDYNKRAQNQQTDPMGKPAEFLQPILKPPFYALDCSYDASYVGCPSLTLGGLSVDEDNGQVKDKNGQVIAGLYAAGRNAVGIAARSYVSGLSIADCIFSGRRAGKHATLH